MVPLGFLGGLRGKMNLRAALASLLKTTQMTCMMRGVGIYMRTGATTIDKDWDLKGT